MSILNKGFRVRKPETLLGINSKNPITQGLSFVLNGSYQYDIGQQQEPFVNTAPSIMTDEGGCLSFDGTAAKHHQYLYSPILTGEMTMFIRARAFANSCVLFGMFSNGAAKEESFHIAIGSGGMLTGVSESLGVQDPFYWANITQGTWYNIIMSSNGNRRFSFNFDGLNTDTGSMTVSRDPTDLNSIVIGAYTDNNGIFSQELNGDVAMALIWNRELALPEQYSILARPNQVFRDYSFRSRFVPRYGQILRPNGVISTGAWQSSLGGALDIPVKDPVANLNTFISTVDPSDCELSFSDPDSPISLLDDTVRYYCSAETGTMKFSVMENTTEIASWTHYPVPTVPTLFSQKLTNEQVATITDRSNLTLKIEAY